MKPVQAAFYARVSSSQQTQVQSIDSQLNVLRERMHKDGLTVQAECEFVDDGWSGATLIRPALEQLRDRVGLAGVDRRMSTRRIDSHASMPIKGTVTLMMDAGKVG